MPIQTTGAPGWAVTPVGRTSLENSLARELSSSIAIDDISFSKPEYYSTTAFNGRSFGFAPRKARINARIGRQGQQFISLFVKIPHDREIEAYVLGRRLGLTRQPRVVAPAVELYGPRGLQKAFCYLYTTGNTLAGLPLTEQEEPSEKNPVWSSRGLPNDILSDLATLHAATIGHASAYIKRGYRESSRLLWDNRLTEMELEEFFELPQMEERRSRFEPLLTSTLERKDELLDLVFSSGQCLIHGDLRPANILRMSDDEFLLLDWGDFSVGSPVFDLAPCLGFDQLREYGEIARTRNNSFQVPQEDALAAGQLVHALANLHRLNKSYLGGGEGLFDEELTPAVFDGWLERIEAALGYL